MFKEKEFFDVNFHKIIDLVSANIYWKNTEGRYLGCNQNVLDHFGLKNSEEIIGKTDAEAFLIPEKEISRFVENDQFALRHGLFEGEEYRTVNGETITFLTKKVAFYNNKGEVAGIMATSLDITNQKNCLNWRKKRQKSNCRLSKLLTSSMQVFFGKIGKDVTWGVTNTCWIWRG